MKYKRGKVVTELTSEREERMKVLVQYTIVKLFLLTEHTLFYYTL